MNGILKLTRFIPDKLYIQIKFFQHFRRFADLKEPKTFNEKLQWLKLYDRKPIYTTMVDKYAVKKYVAEIIGEKYIIPTIGVWKHAKDIDFDSLPNQFVLKCNHDSGGLVIVKDKSNLNRKKTVKFLSKKLKQNGYFYGREWPYKNVLPCVIAEKYMEDTDIGKLCDHKFFCFNGQAKCFKVDFNRFKSHHANCFDSKGNLIKIGEEKCPPDYDKAVDLSSNIDRVKKLVEKLAVNNFFLRTDFYDINGDIYFGELTFYSASGFGEFIFKENDGMLGKWLKLPSESGEGYVLIYEDIIVRFNQKRNGLTDYKVHSFNGEPRIILVCKNRFGENGITEDFYSVSWEHIDIRRPTIQFAEELIEKPNKLNEMLELSRKLSEGIPFLRIDFYIVDNQLYIGELTFFPASGFKQFVPDCWDETMGNWIELPAKEENDEKMFI